MGRKKALDPHAKVVEVYVNSNLSIERTLEKVGVFDTPMLKAMRTLCASRRDKSSFSRAIEEAQAVDIKGSTCPDLSILFLCSWMEIAYRLKRVQEMAVLLERAKALTSDTTPPEITALIMLDEALLAAASGDHEKSERLRGEIPKRLPKGSARYGNYVWHHAVELAMRGRAALVEEELKIIETGTPTLVSLVRLIDAVETGRFEDGARFLKEVERDPELARANAENLLLARTILARMPEWLGRRADSGFWPAAATGRSGGGNPDEALLLRAMDALAARSPRAALDLIRRLAPSGLEECTRGSSPLTFSLVRAELALGNANAARRALDLRHKCGNRHYLDDFFLARMALLDGDKAAASRLFASALDACRRYRAEARLELELRLAVELSPMNIVRMTTGAGANPDIPEGPVGKAPAAVQRNEARGTERLIGPSPALAAAREAILRLAPLDVPVLIAGETGTGKELAARAIHESGPRAEEPFIAVNCGAISESLLESELFGHERGAFTGAVKAHRGLFEEAGRGSILLDEIGEIPPRLQVALLRVLEQGEIRPVGSSSPRRIRCRILAATNADLNDLVERGAFRKDLLFRLRRISLALPPLAERRDDILALAGHFLAEGRTDGMVPEMTPRLREALLARRWSGNVRELRGVIETMRLFNSDGLNYDLDILQAACPGERRDGTATELSGATGDVPGRDRARPEAAATANVSVERGVGPVPEELSAILREGRTSLRRLERLREMFRQCRTLTRSEVVRAMRVSPTTATADLKSLCHEGFIRREEPSGSSRSYYFVIRDGGGD